MNMEIKKLHNVSREKIYEAHSKVFLNYYLPMAENFEEAVSRWSQAGIDFSLSYGAVVDGKIVAFILNVPLASGLYNYSLGVIPEYRGRHLIGEIHKFLPGNKMVLEVLLHNARAIKLYQKLFYTISRELLTLEGVFDCPQMSVEHFSYHVRDFHPGADKMKISLVQPATMSTEEILMRSKKLHETHELRKDGELMAYAHMTPQTLTLHEAGAVEPCGPHLDKLFQCMKLKGEEMRITNFEKDSPLIAYFLERGLRISICQVEMVRELFDIF
jgi:hypothetical protein